MKLNKNIGTLAISLMALVSCSSVTNNSNSSMGIVSDGAKSGNNNIGSNGEKNQTKVVFVNRKEAEDKKEAGTISDLLANLRIENLESRVKSATKKVEEIEKEIEKANADTSSNENMARLEKKKRIYEKDLEAAKKELADAIAEAKGEKEYPDKTVERPPVYFDPLSVYNESNFKLIGFDYLYSGEKVYQGDYISDDVVVEYAEAKNPVLEIDDKDSRYSKYTENVEGKIKVETLDNGKKRITFLDQNTVYVTLRDIKNNKTKEIMLNQPIKINPVAKLEDGIKYEDLKKGSDNGRIQYQLITSNKTYEAENNFAWDRYFGKEKYEDFDDLVGLKEVEVKNLLNNEVSTVKVDFGNGILNYKNKYEELLADLDRFTLKFSSDGESIEGGFNPDLVYLLKKYEKEVNGKEDNLEFVTEILDANNKTVGKHKIARKILKDGKEIFRKEEEAYVAFSGTTVAVADSSFYDVSDAVEARMVRSTPKGLDAKEGLDNDDATLNLDRPHGTTVIGTIIDEAAIGKGNFVLTLGASSGVRQLLIMAMENKFKDNSTLELIRDAELTPLKKDEAKLKADYEKETDVQKKMEIKTKLDKKRKDITDLENKDDEAYLRDALVKFIQYFRRNYKYSETELFKTKYEKNLMNFLTGVRNGLSKIDKDYAKDETKKREELTKKYTELFEIYESMALFSEDEKLAASDMHFKTISLDTGNGGLNPGQVSKYLSKILEEDKNVKAVNMSYGTFFTVEEYIAIRDMSLEDKQKAVDEYNKNAEFRTAVLTSLVEPSNAILEGYKTERPADLPVASLRDYLMSRKEITVADYQKVLDLRLNFLNHYLSDAAELTSSNQDILYVRAQGNYMHNSGQTTVDLTNFDENGKKIIYADTNKIYNNSFQSISTYLNEKEKEKAEKEGREYKYNPLYRKNIVGAIGLAHKILRSGSVATEDISDEYGLYTDSIQPGLLNRFKMYVKEQREYYDSLGSLLEQAETNPENYSKKYIENLKAEMESIDNFTKLYKDYDNRNFIVSFTRAGKAKLWTVATEGQYSYVKELTEEEKRYKEKVNDPTLKTINVGLSPFIPGSSFAAPRITAMAGLIGNKYPWMSAQQIKQSILTTADDDYRLSITREEDKEVGIAERLDTVGLYGVDENIGWGVANKTKALRGPGRFVKALTQEVGEDNFIADIPYGIYEFGNDIAGAFNIYEYMFSRGELTREEVTLSELFINYGDVLDTEEFKTGSKTSAYYEKLREFAKSYFGYDETVKVSKIKDAIAKNIIPKLEAKKNSLDEEEKALFEDAGLVKRGKGSLWLTGDNTFKADTIIEEGDLIIGGNLDSSIYIKEKGKLKLDMTYTENFKRNIIDKVEYLGLSHEPILEGKLIENKGELYSYSKEDTIKNTYKPVGNAKTYIAAIAKLTVGKLDLSESNLFDFNVFRKTGMKVFEENSSSIPSIPTGGIPNLPGGAPKPGDTGDNKIGLTPKNKKSNEGENPDEREVLVVKSVAKKDLAKIKLGTIEYTPFIDLVVETQDIEGDSQNVSLSAKLVRKVKITPETNSLVGDIRAEIINRILVDNGDNLEKLNSDLNDLEWMSYQDSERLKGELLANSLMVGYENADLKTEILKNRINISGKNNEFSVFADTVLSNKFKKDDLDSNVQTKGIILGASNSFENYMFGGSLSIIDSVLTDYMLKLEKSKKVLPNDLTEEEKNKELELKAIKELAGNVNATSFGLNGFSKFKFNDTYLSGLFNVDIISKTTDRKIGDRETVNSDSTDIITNLNLELANRFNLSEKTMLEPFISTNLYAYLKGKFDENLEFGYKSNNETNFKANVSLGARGNIKLSEGISLGANVSYTKFLTDPILKNAAELKAYKFTHNIKGASLDDNVLNYGLDLRYMMSNYEFNLSYKGKNIKNHGINFGLKYGF